MLDNKLSFSQAKKEILNIHKMPVKAIRLSKKQNNLLVSCGDESDLYIKLWNVANSGSEPVNQINTSQIKHKLLAQGGEHDFFSVAAKTSEIRIYHINYERGVLKGVSLVLIAHSMFIKNFHL